MLAKSITLMAPEERAGENGSVSSRNMTFIQGGHLNRPLMAYACESRSVIPYSE
jgi:hypothetical protein